MAIIVSEGFDSVTAPALPAGWNPTPAPGGGGLQYWYTAGTLVGIAPISPPNQCAAGTGTDGVPFFLTYGTPDSDSGQVVVSANVIGYANPGGPPRAGVTARGSAATLTSATSEYIAWVDPDYPRIGVSRVNSGTETQLQDVVAAGSLEPYGLLTLRLEEIAGVTHVRVSHRGTDGRYLSPDGVYHSDTFAWAIDITDGSPIAGAGYAGLWAEAYAGAGVALFDNFTFADLSPVFPVTPLIKRVAPQHFPSFQF